MSGSSDLISDPTNSILTYNLFVKDDYHVGTITVQLTKNEQWWDEKSFFVQCLSSEYQAQQGLRVIQNIL